LLLWHAVKLEEIDELPVDGNFKEYGRITRKIFEKNRESNLLALQRFELISDPLIISRQQLGERINNINEMDRRIDQAISELESQKKELRDKAGKFE
jgi:hypothetical protein